LLLLREHKEPAAGAFDVWGFLCSGGGLALVLFALSQAPSRGWTSKEIVVSGLGGIALLVLLVPIELRQRSPILHLRLYGDRMFRNANLAMSMVFAMLLGVLFLLPLFLQQLRGLSAFVSGLTTAPQALGLLLMSPVASRIYPRVGPRRMLTIALGGVVVTSTLFLMVDLGTDLWWIRAIMFLRGISMSFSIIASQAATFSTISSEEMGRASALFNTNRQVAASLGVAVLATVLSEDMKAPTLGAGPSAMQHAQLFAFHAAFASSIIFGLLGIIFALRIHDEDAASSMG
jgi:MFS family permease